MARSSLVRARSSACAFRSTFQSLRRQRGASSRAGIAPKSGRPRPSQSSSASPSSRGMSRRTSASRRESKTERGSESGAGGAGGAGLETGEGANRRRANEERVEPMVDVVRPSTSPITRANRHQSSPPRGVPACALLSRSRSRSRSGARTAVSSRTSRAERAHTREQCGERRQLDPVSCHGLEQRGGRGTDRESGEDGPSQRPRVGHSP